MKCLQFKKKISQYLAGTLEEKQRQEFEEHLETCSSCTESFSRYLQLPDYTVTSKDEKLDALFKADNVEIPRKPGNHPLEDKGEYQKDRGDEHPEYVPEERAACSGEGGMILLISDRYDCRSGIPLDRRHDNPRQRDKE